MDTESGKLLFDGEFKDRSYIRTGEDGMNHRAADEGGFVSCCLLRRLRLMVDQDHTDTY